jgi:hypothetical protein
MNFVWQILYRGGYEADKDVGLLFRVAHDVNLEVSEA